MNHILKARSTLQEYQRCMSTYNLNLVLIDKYNIYIELNLSVITEILLFVDFCCNPICSDRCTIVISKCSSVFNFIFSFSIISINYKKKFQHKTHQVGGLYISSFLFYILYDTPFFLFI